MGGALSAAHIMGGALLALSPTTPAILFDYLQELTSRQRRWMLGRRGSSFRSGIQLARRDITPFGRGSTKEPRCVCVCAVCADVFGQVSWTQVDVWLRRWRNGHLESLISNGMNWLVSGVSTVEPPNKGHFGNGSFVLSSEVVPISEVHRILIYYIFISSLKCLKWVDNQLGHWMLKTVNINNETDD